MSGTAIIKNVLSKAGIDQARIIINHAQEVYAFEIPEKTETIHDLNKEQMETIVQKLNMLGSINLRPVTREQLADLYDHTLNIWGSPPETSRGEWIEWCLWHHAQRFDDPPIDSKTLEHQSGELRERIREYVETRSELYKERVVESTDEYDDPNEVPDRLRTLLFRPIFPASEK